jgi:hypothetical protein
LIHIDCSSNTPAGDLEIDVGHQNQGDAPMSAQLDQLTAQAANDPDSLETK